MVEILFSLEFINPDDYFFYSPMSRPQKNKVDTQHPSKPLFQNAFDALSQLDTSKLAAAPEPPAPAPTPKPEPVKPEKSLGRVVLRRETKDRGGKTVVIVSGFADLPGFNAAKVADLSRELRKRLGCGGSFDRHEILVQGDRPADVCAALENMGFRVDGVRS